MILSAHLIAGAVIAVKSSQPILGLLLAFLSHYLLDFIPHQEYSIRNIWEKQWEKSFFDFLKIGLDILLGIIIVLFLIKNLTLAFWGGFFGLIPDGLMVLYLFLPKNRFLEKHAVFHRKIIHIFKNNGYSLNGSPHNGPRSNPIKKEFFFLRILSQVLVVVLSIFFIQY